jgi:hypothetical protein
VVLDVADDEDLDGPEGFSPVSDGHNVSDANEQPERTTTAAKTISRIFVKFIVPENP